MATKKAKWNLIDNVLSVELPTGEKASYELVTLFPDFAAYDSVQQNAIAYGVKQGLSDTTARNTDEKLNPAERVAAMNDRWKMISVDRKWTSGKKAGGIKRPTEDSVTTAFEAAQKVGAVPKGMKLEDFLAVSKQLNMIKN